MSTPRDMAETELRDRWGNPTNCPITRPIANVSDTRAPTNTHIDQSTGKNDMLPWIVVIAIMSSLALMGVLMMPMIIDAKVRAAVAQADAKSDLALKTAYTAKDTVDVAISRAKARGEIK